VAHATLRWSGAAQLRTGPAARRAQLAPGPRAQVARAGRGGSGVGGRAAGPGPAGVRRAPASAGPGVDGRAGGSGCARPGEVARRGFVPWDPGYWWAHLRPASY